MNVPYPDNPGEVSVDFLEKLDKDPAGTWVGQPKLDGWRRIVHVDDGVVRVQAKHGADTRMFPENIKKDLSKKIDGMTGLSLDCEWVGPRKDAKHLTPGDRLFCFDILRHNGEWLRDTPFAERILLLDDLKLLGVPVFTNPELVEKFYVQLTDPMSEGIVIRHASSKLILRDGRCADNPLWFKAKMRWTNRVLQFNEGQ